MRSHETDGTAMIWGISSELFNVSFSEDTEL